MLSGRRAVSDCAVCRVLWTDCYAYACCAVLVVCMCCAVSVAMTTATITWGSVSRDRVLVAVSTSARARVWAREFSRSFGVLTGRPRHSGRVVGPTTVEPPDGSFSAADRGSRTSRADRLKSEASTKLGRQEFIPGEVG